jgi:phage I-like protein
VCFDTPIPDPDKVRQLSDQAFGQDAKTDLFDYVDGKVSITQAQTAALSAKLEEDVVAKFRRTKRTTTIGRQGTS